MKLDPAREAARSAGECQYSTAEPCKNGHPSQRWTRNGACVLCCREKVARWKLRNPGYDATGMTRLRRAKDPTKHRAEVKRWARKNQERVAEILKRWKAANPERRKLLARVSQANRRARTRDNGGSFAAADIEALYARQHGTCAVCPSTDGLEVDHILPIILGGSSDPSNLQLLCLPCNRSKGGKHPDVWREEMRVRSRGPL